MSNHLTPVKASTLNKSEPNQKALENEITATPNKIERSNILKSPVEGFHTPVVSKKKGILIAARREMIGTMSSFFKKTTNRCEEESSDPEEPLDMEDDERKRHIISSFSGGLKRGSHQLSALKSDDKTDNHELHEEVLKPLQKVKTSHDGPISQSTQISSNLLSALNACAPLKRDSRNLPRPKVEKLKSCSLCGQGIKFHKIQLRCCPEVNLCLRCHLRFYSEEVNLHNACPFCKNPAEPGRESYLSPTSIDLVHPNDQCNPPNDPDFSQ